MEGKRLSAEHNCDNIAMFAKSTSSRKMCCFSSLEWCVLHTQSCPTLCYPMDSSPPGSSVHGIFQTRILEWVAISFSNAWKWKVKVKSLSRVGLFTTPWTAARQAPPSMGFSMQEYWSGLPFPSPMQESEKWKWSRTVSVRLFVIPWTTAYQSPPSMGFSRQEYWSGVPLPSPIYKIDKQQGPTV